METRQTELFSVKTKYEEEWEGMPEFRQGKVEPYAKIIIRFDSENDLKKFSELINQKLTKKTKSIWYPFKSHWGGIASGLEYVDEP